MSVTGTIGAIGAIGGGIASAVGASKASGAQADAANNAANLERQNAVDALNFQKQVYGNQQQNIAPWLASGKGALSNLDYLMGITPQNATAPTQAAGNPGGNPDPNVNTPSDPLTFAGRGVNPVTGRPLPIPFSAQSAMLPAGATGQRGSILQRLLPGEAGTPGGAGTQLNMNPPITSPGTNGGFNMNPPITSPGTGGVTTATTNQGGTGQVPFGGTGGFLGDQGGPGSLGTVPGGGFGSLAQGFNEKFAAPTNVTEQNDPGFQFREAQGNKAIQNSAAARGGLLSGGTAKALSDYNQSSASGEYGNVYNRALTEYQQRYNIFNNNQSTLFNRLADLSGFGQTAAGQLNSAGTSAANNTSNTLLTSGQQIGQNINNAGAANASGYVGVGNAISGGLNNLASIYALLRSQGGGGAAPDPTAGMGVF